MMRGPLAVALFAAQADRLHYGLVLALSAAAMGRKTCLFFAGPAIDLLWGERWPELGLTAFESAAKARGVATVAEMRDLIGELGIAVLVCETALRLAGREGVPFDPAWRAEIAGAISYLEAGKDGQILFI